MKDTKTDISEYFIDSPLGCLYIDIKNGHIIRLEFRDSKNENVLLTNGSIHPGINQLYHYFNNELKEFELPVNLEGTAFQKRVWGEIAAIPYGSTQTYGEIASSLGNKNSVRAVGRAVGANPVSVVIPCHRVMGSNGKLTGYSGGLWRKKWLLKHEGITIM